MLRFVDTHTPGDCSFRITTWSIYRYIDDHLCYHAHICHAWCEACVNPWVEHNYGGGIRPVMHDLCTLYYMLLIEMGIQWMGLGYWCTRLSYFHFVCQSKELCWPLTHTDTLRRQNLWSTEITVICQVALMQTEVKVSVGPLCREQSKMGQYLKWKGYLY